MRIGVLTTIEHGRDNLLRQFIRHYSQWCAPEDIHVVVRMPEGASFMSETVCIAHEAGAVAYPINGPYSTYGNIELQRKLTHQIFDWEGFHFNVDSDEFFRHYAAMHDMIGTMDRIKADALLCRMVDRVAADGSMPDIPWPGPIEDAFPVESMVTEKLQLSYDRKACFLRNPIYGHHSADSGRCIASHLSVLDHYKWDSTALERLRARIVPEARKRIPYWKAFAALLAHLDAGGSLLDTEPRKR